MLRPAATQLLKNGESPYSLVIAVAKRARTITDDAYENKVHLEQKSVKMAVEELASGEYKIIEKK